MRLILILVVMAVIGLLSVRAMKSQSESVASVARQAGVDVPQSATPRQQVEAVGAAVEKMQADSAAKQREQIEQSTQQ